MGGTHFKDGMFPDDLDETSSVPGADQQPDAFDILDEDYDQDAGVGYVQPYELQQGAPQQPVQPQPVQQPLPQQGAPQPEPFGRIGPNNETPVQPPLNPYVSARAEGRAHSVPNPDEQAADESGDGRSSKRRLFSNVLIAVGLALILVAGGIWLYSQYRYAQQNQINEQLAGYVTLSDDASQAPIVDWAGLKAINADIVGWIQIPGTQVNYPVYQGRDNDQYLRTTAEGEYSIGGQLFLDYQNTAPGMVDPQSIIYGHHLANGTMFKDVADMDRDDNFAKCKTIWYLTEQNTYECEPLMLYYTDANDLNVRKFTFDDDAAFHSYLKGLLDKSQERSSDASMLVDHVSHVLSLVTCNYYDGYGRTLFMCVPKAEANAARIAVGQVTK